MGTFAALIHRYREFDAALGPQAVNRPPLDPTALAILAAAAVLIDTLDIHLANLGGGTPVRQEDSEGE